MRLSWSFLGPGGSFNLGGIYLPMGDIYLWGDWECRDWMKEGVVWWRREIAAFVQDYSKKATVHEDF